MTKITQTIVKAPKALPKPVRKRNPATPKKTEKKEEVVDNKNKQKNTLTYTDYIILSVGLFFVYIIYSLFDNIVKSIMIKSAIHQGLSAGYEYAQYVSYRSPVYTAVGTLIIVLTIIGFFLYKFYKNDDSLVVFILRSMRIIVVANVPILILVFLNYESVDKVMYKFTKKLYDIANEDKSFKNTETAIQFKKALDENDYTTLKTISNDINRLAKLPKEKLAEIEEIVSVISVPEIKNNFNTFKNGYKSYKDYDIFYNKSIKILSETDYRFSSELQYLMKKIKITTYDYGSIKTIIE